MIESDDEEPLKAAEEAGWSKPLSASGNRLARLELLHGVSSRQSTTITSSTILPEKKTKYQVEQAVAGAILEHGDTNVRFNIVISKPRMVFRSSEISKMGQKLTAIPQNPAWKAQLGEQYLSLPVLQKTAACLAPFMQFIVETLSADGNSEFLGSLPRHLVRAAKLSLERPQLDLDGINQEISIISYEEFKSKYISSAQESARVQLYLDHCSRAKLLEVGELVKNDLDNLLTHKYGYLIVRSLIGVHLELTNRTQYLCAANFAVMATNEFASRTMQRLVETSDQFRLYSLKRFSKDTSLWLKSVPGLFVLAACLRCSDSREYNFVTDLLLNNRSKLIASKIMKRALVSVVEALCNEELHYVFGYLNIERKFMRFLEDKHMTYILIAFTRRDFVPAVKILTDQIRSHFKELVSKPYFKLLANKLISVASEHTLNAINESLTSFDSSAFLNLCDGGRNLQNLYYYIFLTFSSFRTESPAGTQRLLNFAHWLCSSPAIQKVDNRLANALRDCLIA